MDAKKLMGYESPGDRKVPVMVRDWHAMKLACWRSRSLSDIVVREASEILARCRHAPGCLGAEDEMEPCLATSTQAMGDAEVLTASGCPDREVRMSALVIINAARQLSPPDARKPSSEPYYAPSREYFSEVLAEFSAMQIENALLREALRAAGIPEPKPGNSTEGAPLSASSEAAQLPSAKRRSHETRTG